jgi:hypothetical protein
MTKIGFAKRTGSHADVLAAVGAADLIELQNPTLVGREDRLDVEVDTPITASDFNNVGPGFKYLKVPLPDSDGAAGGARKSKRTPPKVPSAHVFDYAAENERYKRQTAAKDSKDAAIIEAVQQDSADPEFRLYRIVKALQAESGLNKFVEQFFALTEEQRKSEVLAALGGKADFFFEAPMVQLFNPHSAKGYSLLKPTGTDRNDKTKEKWAEPFHEWLRYRGFFAGAAGWFFGPKGEHIRVYCPIPGRIRFRVLKQVVAKFRYEPLFGSAPKMDCLAVLRLVRHLLSRSEEFARPSSFISGVWVTHYQSLGQVRAVTAMDRLAVPNWFDLKSQDDVQLWLETLDEHDRVPGRPARPPGPSGSSRGSLCPPSSRPRCSRTAGHRA